MPDEASLTPSRLSERYRILFPVGKGGMGTVEVALEKGSGTFRRVIAVKHMLKEVSRERRNVDMFLREAQLAQMLNHPNVVHAFEAGELDGELYIAMEYVEGEPLSTVLRRARDGIGGMSPALAAHVLAEVCDGLHAAHELRDPEGKLLNVVHRDLSPHNVMVAYEGHVKLLDFGVAKVDDAKKVTHTGEVKGKTAYMAPEQALGDPIDRRSDLFAVGAVLFECLTGRRMWGQASDIQLMRRLALEEPPRLESVLENAPPELVQLYNKLVARKPDDRLETARDVARDLRAYIGSTAEAADDRAMRALMQECFSFEATEKRKLLEESLAEVVDPARAKELRKSLSLSTAPLTETERRMIAAMRAPEMPPRVTIEAKYAAHRTSASGTSDTYAAIDPRSKAEPERRSMRAAPSASDAYDATLTPGIARSSRRTVGAVALGVVILGVGGAAIAALTREPPSLTNDRMDIDAAPLATTSASVAAAPSPSSPTIPASAAIAPSSIPSAKAVADAATTLPPSAPTKLPVTGPAPLSHSPAPPHPHPHPPGNQPDIDDHAL